MLRRVCLVAVVCMLVPAALSDVRIFFTKSSDPYGLTKPQNAFAPSFGAGLDAAEFDVDENPLDPPLAVAAFPTYRPAVSHTDPTREFLYVWVQFYSTGAPGDPNYLPVNGTLVSLTLAVHASPDAIAWYRVDNSNSIDGLKRWGGAATAPNYPEFRQLNQDLNSGAAYGIMNSSTANPTQLWSGGSNNGTSGRIALLGAIKPSFADVVTFRVTAPQATYRTPDGSTYPVATSVASWFIPEPASVLLLGLAGPLMRRR